MSKTDIGPPNYQQMIPEVIKNNYGNWKYHEVLKPGVLKHVSETGDELYTVRVGNPRVVSVDFIRDLCDIADRYCDGHLRFTSRFNIEFLTPDKTKVDAIIEAAKKLGLPAGGTGHSHLEHRPYPGMAPLPQRGDRQLGDREGPDGRAL